MNNEPTIEQMNLSIAKFMGMEGSDEFIRQNYKYHSRWELLMPVIVKISKMQLENALDYSDTCFPRTFGMPAPDGLFMVRINGFSCHKADTLIEAAHAAVYEVAEYHNKQQSNEQA